MYINLKKEKEIKNEYYSLYLKYNKGIYKILKRKFLNSYKQLPYFIQLNNQEYINNLIQKNKFLNNIDGYKLDDMQKNIVLSEEENTLVVAGAGSGKTLTLVARIIYLLRKGIDSQEILCLTLTNSCADNLRQKLHNYNIDLEVLTFHKLGLRILKQNGYYFKIASDNELEKIIDRIITYRKVMDIIPDLKFKTIDYYGRKCGCDKLIKKLQTLIFKQSSYYFYLKQTIFTFITLFKNNNYEEQKFSDFIKENEKEKNKYKKKRQKKYLFLLKLIYQKYENHLEKNNKIDFSDMINKAINSLVNVNNIEYKYIIIDEYQDISLAKCFLLKKIQEKTQASVLAIGDDWQSIYRFTGADLSVFTDFEKYFPNTKVFKLNNTYRNSNELLEIMGKFIMKNKKQMSKQLESNKKLLKPILIYYYEDNQQEILNKLVSSIKSSYFILGRNNNDINLVSKQYQKHFITVHKAKGLESDIVIIINLENSNVGFPNKIINDDILKYVTIKDIYPYEEERRLFYVALTRTRTYNILLVNKNCPSIFAQEIIKENPEKVRIMSCFKCQKMLSKKPKENYICQDFPECNYG